MMNRIREFLKKETVLCVAAVCGYYILDKLFINSAANEYQDMPVRDFVGMSYSEELEDFFDASPIYYLVNVEYQYSDTIEEGKIISQSPSAGVKKKFLAEKQKIQIDLVVSKGPETTILEDYTVRDYREAEAALRKQGLVVVIEEAASNYLDIGYVVRTEPEAGTVMNIGDSVTLYVNYGSDTIKTSVPNFVGMTEADALIHVIENQLEVGDVTYERSNNPAGTIIRQSADAWVEIAKYSKIDFVVSGGAGYSGDGTTPPPKVSASVPENKPPLPQTETETDTSNSGNSSGGGLFPGVVRG